MDKLLGYMVTWTTFGTWLQGDRRGYVKNGQIKNKNKNLELANKRFQKTNRVHLNNKQKEMAETMIKKEAERIGQKLLAIAVCSNHIHLVLIKHNESIESSVSRYKNVATKALKETGLKNRIWTRGFDKRFCFTEDDLKKKIRYVINHKN